MRSIVVALALLVAAGTSAAQDAVDAVYTARSSLVQIVGFGADDRYSLGSGIALPGDSVLTSCHVTARAQRIEPVFAPQPASADLQQIDVMHDLCVLHIPGLAARPAELAQSNELRVGDKVYALGFNGGKDLSYTEGEVAELFEFDGGMVIRTTAQFRQGASGGGLFDKDGRLVGILTFYRITEHAETSFFAVPVEWVRRVLAQPSRTVEPFDGLPFWADTFERQPAFLQTSALEASQRWQDLARLARERAAANPRDVQAWAALAKAARKTGDTATAEAALRSAAQNGRSIQAATLHQ